MGGTDFLLLYLFSLIFGVVLSLIYDVIWVLRTFFFRNRLVWVADFLVTFSAGVMIGVLQYNFLEGRFRAMPMVAFFVGVVIVRLTISRAIRLLVSKIINLIHRAVFILKIKAFSAITYKYYVFMSRRGFGLIN